MLILELFLYDSWNQAPLVSPTVYVTLFLVTKYVIVYGRANLIVSKQEEIWLVWRGTVWRVFEDVEFCNIPPHTRRLLTLWNRVPLYTLTVFELVKKFQACYSYSSRRFEQVQSSVNFHLGLNILISPLFSFLQWNSITPLQGKQKSYGSVWKHFRSLTCT